MRLYYKFKRFDFLRLDSNTFKKCPSLSIDIAVMEQTKKQCFTMDVGWDDLGNWRSLGIMKRKIKMEMF